MAITLITTPGASNANSYADVSDADTYHESHLYPDAWNNATDDQKKAALVWATRLLDNELDYVGFKTSVDQKLFWPRVGVWDREGNSIDDDIIPDFVVNAVSELARKLLEADRTAEPGTKGFKQISVGPITLTVDKNDAQFDPIPDSVMSIMQDYASFLSSSSMVSIGRS